MIFYHRVNTLFLFFERTILHLEINDADSCTKSVYESYDSMVRIVGR